MRWNKTGRTVYATGESTTFYASDNGLFRIESRKRAIPHSNKPGTWMHTYYYLINNQTGEEKEFHALKDAKESAEVFVNEKMD